MELAFDMGLGAWVVVVVAGLAAGLVAQLVDDGMSLIGWVIDAVAFTAGAVFASEVLTTFRGTGPVWDNLALVPALVGGLVLGLVAEALVRIIAGGVIHGSQGPMSA